ncbi:uncharacterized protein KY384_001718 [Bacidia gigantensis]|uniref:uncharacterized protein n=1 Tax=Bacidia gigantensis TaxID=2732470 RepID=UPI001D047668|nr:uncharacterized protein KY384_001718 [Bacidia gigantensis]KAG8533975.1 hypothetical protein KY384_001718 [Bacidia gigantensis]
MYVGGSKRRTNKWAWAMKMFGQYDESAFDTLDHEKHRLRREPWGPYFSKQSVSRLQPTLIQDKVNLFCSRLAEHKAAGKPVTMIYAYACVTTDIISDYCYPSGYNYLSQPDFDTAHYDAWMVLTLLSHTLKQFGWLFPLLNAMPPWLTKRTSPEAYLVQSFKSELTQQAKDVIAFSNSASKDSESKPSRPSLLQALYESPALPPADKALSRLAAEAQTAIAAGTLTSSHVLKAATFHILANPRIRDRLMEELEQAIPDIDTPHPPNLRELEAIEYLVAIMYESLRIAHGVSGRLQRIFPDYDLPYRRSAKTDSSDDGDTVGVVVIPRGTPISMTPLHAHEDPRVFVDPYTFDPERWIPLSTNGLRLQKYLMCFGAGSRICVGMELGKAEILTCLASVFRRFGGRGEGDEAGGGDGEEEGCRY